MRSHISVCTKTAAVIGLCVSAATGCTSCGEDAGDKKQRLLVQKRITRELMPAHDANEFMCMRLPQSGPDAVVVVTSSKEAPTANALLRRYKINGSVEVKTPYEYNMDILHLAEQIEKAHSKTKAFSVVHVSDEVLHGALTCPKADIELGLKGEASQLVINWARSVKAHYGSDRVRYKHNELAHLAVVHNRARYHSSGSR